MENQNPWWMGEPDDIYDEWRAARIKWVPEIIDEISTEKFSLHFFVGARQVGKTTALKIFIHRLLEEGWNPKSIFYYSCDEIVDYRELGELLDTYISARQEWGVKKSVIILDEITFVEDWWRAIKSRIDRRMLKNDIMVITGSASIELLKQKELFPGRRGGGKDLVLHPLDFARYVELFGGFELRKTDLKNLDGVENCLNANKMFFGKIIDIFTKYLRTGGFPVPVIEFFEKGRVTANTLKIYLDWLRGDCRKAGKSDRYMKEVLAYILKSRVQPVSWLGIAKDTSINSPHTAQSYVETLENFFVVKTLHIISPDSKILYRKNKKIHITDPSLYHAFKTYTGVETLEETIVESVVISHLSRVIDVFFWRNASEIDSVCVINGKQIGFEVKWGFKSWRKPMHLDRVFLLDKNEIPVFLASIRW